MIFYIYAIILGILFGFGHIFLGFIIAIIFPLYYFVKDDNIVLLNKMYSKDELNNVLKNIEKDYAKKYPLEGNFFSISHYPNYLDFFEQFKSYKYYGYMEANKITATCCFAKLHNIDATYVCDLKSNKIGNRVTYKFLKYYIIRNFDFKMFGIVMQPNWHITRFQLRYGLKEYDTLNLYDVEYDKILENIEMFKDYFGEFSFRYGYKKLTLYDKDDNLIESKTLIHLYRLNSKNLNNQNNTITSKLPTLELKRNDKIMFCVPENHKFVTYLESKNIKFANKMDVIGNKLTIKNFEFIETTMI